MIAAIWISLAVLGVAFAVGAWAICHHAGRLDDEAGEPRG